MVNLSILLHHDIAEHCKILLLSIAASKGPNYKLCVWTVRSRKPNENYDKGEASRDCNVEVFSVIRTRNPKVWVPFFVRKLDFLFFPCL